jgi:hypothetical protein
MAPRRDEIVEPAEPAERSGDHDRTA